MKVTREAAAASRERILESAARLFRENGLDGIGVADLMKDAGLTHGGFYGHFASKDELKAEACARTLERSLGKWTRIVQDERDPLAAIAKSYLSPRHRDNPGSGCALASIGGDVARQESPVRHAVTEGVKALVDVLASVTPGKSKAARRRAALAAYSSLIGALVLARAVDDAKLSEEILRATAASVACAR
jgi:TetR/AcrR family transcriptional repressor of nem operon